MARAQDVHKGVDTAERAVGKPGSTSLDFDAQRRAHQATALKAKAEAKRRLRLSSGSVEYAGCAGRHWGLSEGSEASAQPQSRKGRAGPLPGHLLKVTADTEARDSMVRATDSTRVLLSRQDTLSKGLPSLKAF